MPDTHRNPPSREQIEERAHQRFVERGSVSQDPLQDWLAAERELIAEAQAEAQAQAAVESEATVALETQSKQEAILSLSINKSPAPASSPDGQQPRCKPMLVDFFGLREQPFGVTPDPAYLYSSKTHSDALASLAMGVTDTRGFLTLIAEPGMGKTTLLYQMLEQLQDSARAVLIFQSECTPREFIEYILHDLGVDVSGMGLVAMHGKLNEILFEELMKGKRFVLVVDEAQNLADSVLETVRMLSNFETHNAKLLQIVLAGQPALAAKLAQPKMSQLRQRVSVLATLQPFTPEDTRLYIEHRLRVAGFTGESMFEPASIRLIARQSKGIPRNINNLCYNSMVLSYSRGRRIITPEIVQEVIDGLDLEALFPQASALAAAAGETSAGVAGSAVAPSGVSPNATVSGASAAGASVTGASASGNGAAGTFGNGSSASTASASGAIAADASKGGAPNSSAPKASSAASGGHVISSSAPAAAAAAAAKTPAPRVAAVLPAPVRKDPHSKSSLTYTGDRTNNFLKWSGRSAAVAAILISGSLFLTILLGRAESRQALTRGMFDHTSSDLGDALPVAATNATSSLYDASPQDTGTGQVLTVAAGAQQSLKDLSMRYAGRFDGNLEKQIISLNPGLRDPNHLEAGQLIRIPLPPGALRQVNDTAMDSGDASSSKSGSLFARLTAMLRNRN